MAFGSYGWGGQSIGQIEEELKNMGCEIILDKIRLLNVPTEEQLQDITMQIADSL